MLRKKIICTCMTTTLILAAIAPVLSDNVSIVYAAESKALRDAKAKISHLTNSLKTNYLGIKNQATWELYIKQARELIKKIPNSEKSQRNALTVEVNKDEALVNALSRINQVEKSITPKSEGGYGNYLGIKNAETWREYLRLAESDLEKVDKTIFQKQYDELIGRKNKVSEIVKKIEDEFQVEYDRVVKLYEEAKSNNDISKAKKALIEAEKLGTCDRSDALEKEIKKFISEDNSSNVIKNNEYVAKDEDGRELYKLKINKITTMAERNEYSKLNPKQVLLIDYTYTNINYKEDLFISSNSFKVVDSNNKLGYTYPNSVTKYPDKVPAGVTCDGQVVFGVDNVSSKIKLYFEHYFSKGNAIFEVPIDDSADQGEDKVVRDLDKFYNSLPSNEVARYKKAIEETEADEIKVNDIGRVKDTIFDVDLIFKDKDGDSKIKLYYSKNLGRDVTIIRNSYSSEKNTKDYSTQINKVCDTIFEDENYIDILNKYDAWLNNTYIDNKDRYYDKNVVNIIDRYTVIASITSNRLGIKEMLSLRQDIK